MANLIFQNELKSASKLCLHLRYFNPCSLSDGLPKSHLDSQAVFFIFLARKAHHLVVPSQTSPATPTTAFSETQA